MSGFQPDSVQFAVVSFEGPDEYSRAGGLAVRVRDLTEALAAAGFRTHLFFVGDPDLPGEEPRGNLTLHRWCQWISAYHLDGVYDGEWGKMQDLVRSLPPYLIDEIVLPGIREGRMTAVMGEDWQIAPVMIALGDSLDAQGLTRHVVPVWTANNLYGFESVDLVRLQESAAIMTVSRYMKHQMWSYGLNPLVVPNGIAPEALAAPLEADVCLLEQTFSGELMLFKIGRFSPDKRWLMALDAVAIANRLGIRTRMLMRGDRLPYGREVLSHARLQGLRVEDLSERYEGARALAAAIAARPEADVLNLTAFLSDDLVRTIYAAVDGVLANSGHEPFGLVGLEVMGAGGLAFVGSTGEEYARADENAVVLDTDDPREIVVELRHLRGNKEKTRRLRQRGKETARAYLWSNVLQELFSKLEYVALARGVEVP